MRFDVLGIELALKYETLIGENRRRGIKSKKLKN